MQQWTHSGMEQLQTWTHESTMTYTIQIQSPGLEKSNEHPENWTPQQLCATTLIGIFPQTMINRSNMEIKFLTMEMMQPKHFTPHQNQTEIMSANNSVNCEQCIKMLQYFPSNNLTELINKPFSMNQDGYSSSPTGTKGQWSQPNMNASTQQSFKPLMPFDLEVEQPSPWTITFPVEPPNVILITWPTNMQTW